MVQLQILNKVLQEKNIGLITQNNLDKRFFRDYSEEFYFITNHYDRYKTVPDIQTMVAKFPDFQVFRVEESDRYLVETILEEKLYSDMAPVLNRIAEYLKDDANEAVDYALRELPKLMTRRSIFGEDIVVSARTRLEEVLNKSKKKAKGVVSTGMVELDQVIDGWEPGEELVTLVGRTNQGKTWLGLKWLKEAFKQGKRVGMYSGEMSSRKIGYRFDTFMSGISNRQLVKGSVDIDTYKRYVEGLEPGNVPFVVVTPKDLGGRATVSDLKSFIEEYHLDLLLIDGYLLMRDERRGSDRTTRLEHILQDLWDLTVDAGVPIIGLAQANRGGAKKSEDGGTPELEDIYGADAIGQYSSKVISMKQTGAGLELGIKKNRDGQVGSKLVYFWDIDRGDFKYIPTTEDATGGQQVDAVRKEFEKKDIRDIF